MIRSRVVIALIALAFSFPAFVHAGPGPDIPRARLAPSATTPEADDPDAALLVRTLEHATPQTPARLWEVFRGHVRSEAHERIFFAHPAFIALGATQPAFFDLMAEEAPRRLLELHRRRSLEAAYGRLVGRLGEREERIIRRVSSLSIPEQLGLYLGGRTDLSGLSRRQKHALSRERRIERMLADPSLEGLPLVEDAWFVGLAVEHLAMGLLYVDAGELVQCKVMIARNLYFVGETPTRENVRREYARILDLRQRYRDLALFSQRHVVYAASDERAGRTRDYVFGREATRDDLERQGARVAFLRDGEREAEKARLADELQQASRLTFLFEGHGRENGILFARGLSAKELTRTLTSRVDSGDARGAANPILIPVTCRGHDLFRSLLGRLHAADPSAPKPIAIVPEEYGQDFVKPLHGDPFFTRELELGRGERTTLGTLFDHSTLGTSVYVPDERNVPAQIL